MLGAGWIGGTDAGNDTLDGVRKLGATYVLDGEVDLDALAISWVSVTRPAAVAGVRSLGGSQNGLGSLSHLVAPLPRSSVTSTSRVQEIVSRYEWDIGIAARIILCESGGSASVVNVAGHAGLFQVSPIHRWEIEWLLVPANNVVAAYELYTHSGWQPWASSIGCWGY